MLILYPKIQKKIYFINRQSKIQIGKNKKLSSSCLFYNMHFTTSFIFLTTISFLLDCTIDCTIIQYFLKNIKKFRTDTKMTKVCLVISESGQLK